MLAVVAPSGFVTTGPPGQWATMTGAQVAWLCSDGTGGEPGAVLVPADLPSHCAVMARNASWETQAIDAAE